MLSWRPRKVGARTRCTDDAARPPRAAQANGGGYGGGYGGGGGGYGQVRALGVFVRAHRRLEEALKGGRRTRPRSLLTRSARMPPRLTRRHLAAATAVVAAAATAAAAGEATAAAAVAATAAAAGEATAAAVAAARATTPPRPARLTLRTR
jgi:hypothetical protein